VDPVRAAVSARRHVAGHDAVARTRRPSEQSGLPEQRECVCQSVRRAPSEVVRGRPLLSARPLSRLTARMQKVIPFPATLTPRRRRSGGPCGSHEHSTGVTVSATSTRPAARRRRRTSRGRSSPPSTRPSVKSGRNNESDDDVALPRGVGSDRDPAGALPGGRRSTGRKSGSPNLDPEPWPPESAAPGGGAAECGMPRESLSPISVSGQDPGERP
jgi:hypothetical protein